jgi:hypothetical protein
MLLEKAKSVPVPRHYLAVACEHVVTVRDHGLQRLQIRRRF